MSAILALDPLTIALLTGWAVTGVALVIALAKLRALSVELVGLSE
jgi:hypothetical protein